VTAAVVPPPAAPTARKTADPVAPAAPRERIQATKTSTRVEAVKAQAAPGGIAALTAKAAEALQPVSGGAPSVDADDEPVQEAPPEAKADAGAAPQAPANPATAATTTPTNLMHAAAVAVRGQPQTVANLAAQIVKKLDGRTSQFDVQLDPAGLGKVDVRIAIGADGRMSAAMSFDTPQAAAELKARAGELHQAMAQAGFDLTGGMSFDVASDPGQGQGQGNQAQTQDQQTNTGAAFRGRAFQTALDTSADAVPPQFMRRRTALAGVDIRI
jgi:flagellar hook-length control protein FliK